MTIRLLNDLYLTGIAACSWFSGDRDGLACRAEHAAGSFELLFEPVGEGKGADGVPAGAAGGDVGGALGADRGTSRRLCGGAPDALTKPHTSLTAPHPISDGTAKVQLALSG